MYDHTSWITPDDQKNFTVLGGHLGTNQEGKYFFWDECEMDAHGPYNSLDDAKAACVAYAKTI
jgi:hypothetical protein